MKVAGYAFALALCCTAAAAAQTAAPSPAPAASPTASSNGWNVSITPYLWLPNLNGQFTFHVPSAPIAGAALSTIDVHVGPSKYLTHLNSAAMLAAYAYHGTTSLATDVMYLNLSSSDASVTTVTGPNGRVEVPINVSTSAHFRGTIWTLEIGQRVTKSTFSPAEVVGGFRALGATSSADWNFQGPLDILPRSGSASRSLHVWDFVAGGRGRLGLGAHWYVPYYADYGGGSNNNTFQAYVGIANSYGWGDIVLVNRWLWYWFNNERNGQSIQLIGPALGVRVNL